MIVRLSKALLVSLPAAERISRSAPSRDAEGVSNVRDCPGRKTIVLQGLVRARRNVKRLFPLIILGLVSDWPSAAWSGYSTQSLALFSGCCTYVHGIASVARVELRAVRH